MIKTQAGLVYEKDLLVKFICETHEEVYIKKGKLMKRTKYFNETYFKQHDLQDIQLEVSKKTLDLLYKFIMHGEVLPEMFEDEAFCFYADYFRFPLDTDQVAKDCFSLIDIKEKGRTFVPSPGSEIYNFNEDVYNKLDDTFRKTLIKFVVDNKKDAYPFLQAMVEFEIHDSDFKVDKNTEKVLEKLLADYNEKQKVLREKFFTEQRERRVFRHTEYSSEESSEDSEDEESE